MPDVNIRHVPKILLKIPLPECRSKLQNESPTYIFSIWKIEKKFSFTFRRNVNAPVH
jgi:hypothetical protein